MPPLLLTMGEPAGIGGELALLAWQRRAEGVPAFALLDDPARLQALARRLGLAVPVVEIVRPSETEAAWRDGLPVLPLALPAPVEPGRLDVRNSPAVIAAIEQAVDLVQRGEAAAMVTNPIHKHVLMEAGFAHPGHTEFLAALAGPGTIPVMMLACPGLQVVPITVHMALRDAIASLDAEKIATAARITAAGLRRDFGLAAPRLAMAGLNPHAGEAGAFGREEIELIAPTIARLRAEGLDVVGPLPPDTMFHAAARARYDVALCMYHDQALIPIKTIDFERGVNVTLGLPFIRTSPDHGTALDIAGTGRASPASLIAALTMAAEMAVARNADLSETLIEAIRRHGIEPRKALGQNFLLDKRIVARIAAATGPLDGVSVVEVGPGPGGLTRALLEGGAARVVAIERDQRCLPLLRELAEAHPRRLEIVEGDALAVDAATLVPAPRRLIANLPYNVATPLLIGWLRQIGEWQALGLMFQKEVAQRLVARPRHEAYGRLSILTQWLTEPSLAFDLAPGAFLPPPKVVSTVVYFQPRPEPLAPCRFEDLERVTAAAFGQRRKMLRSSLKSLGVDAAALCEAAGVNPTQRAEELTVPEFCALARAVADDASLFRPTQPA